MDLTPLSALEDSAGERFLIIDNDYKTVTVWGDATANLGTSATFHVIDVHLDPAVAPKDSACRDHGTNADVGVDETDIDGGHRREPYPDGTVDIGADEVVD